jgi:amidase
MERLRLAGRIRRPTADEIRDIAATEYMRPTLEEARELATLIDEMLRLFDRLDDLPQPVLPLKYRDRDPGCRPTPEEDPYNVFIRKCRVTGADRGRLTGKTVGLKDNICVANVPMTNGSRLIPHYVPDLDATVVERLLDAGATIIGKLNMDDLAFSGTGETSAFGCVRNPCNPDYSAGGSSSGAGAAVAAGAVDIALGVDEGGSGRIPAAWCGVVSIKPTHGLVPTFGITYMDHTTDFICPTARTVRDVALTLDVIAGDDPKDPQWVRGSIRTDDYTRNLGQGIEGLRLGVLSESLDPAIAEPDVIAAVDQAVATLVGLGASSRTVSLPIWRDARAIWNGFAAHSVAAMIESDLEVPSRGGWCNLGWQEAFGKARRAGSDCFPPVLKVLIILGKYLRREYGGIYLSKALNLRFAMREQVNRLFEEFDVLVTPTIPMKAFRLLDHPVSAAEVVRSRATSMGQNTYPTNVTGHPSLTVPCGRGSECLPIGLQLIGQHFGESLLFRVGHTFEQAGAGVRLAERR